MLYIFTFSYLKRFAFVSYHVFCCSSNQLHLTNQEVRILQDLLPMKCITRHVNILKHSENTNAILNAIEDMRKYILSSICRRGMHAKDTKTDSFHNSFQILLDTLADEMISKRLVAYNLISIN